MEGKRGIWKVFANEKYYFALFATHSFTKFREQKSQNPLSEWILMEAPNRYYIDRDNFEVFQFCECRNMNHELRWIILFWNWNFTELSETNITQLSLNPNLNLVLCFDGMRIIT